MKQKDIAPGRVIQRIIPDYVDMTKQRGKTYTPFMIVGFKADVKRRHAKSKAPKIWLGTVRSILWRFL